MNVEKLQGVPSQFTWCGEQDPEEGRRELFWKRPKPLVLELKDEEEVLARQTGLGRTVQGKSQPVQRSRGMGCFWSVLEQSGRGDRQDPNHGAPGGQTRLL